MKNSLLIYECATNGAAPEWICIVPLGKTELRDQRPSFEATRADLEALMQTFRADGVRLVIDYEHKTLTGDKAVAAGWITDLEIRGDGLYARVDWTAEARQEIASKKYGYYSPVLRLEPETRRVQKLLHAGLTNTPAIKNLPPLLAAKYGEGGEPEILILTASGTPAPPKPQEATAMLKKLIEKMGLKPETTEAEVLALVESRAQEAVALKAQADFLPEIAVALGLEKTAEVAQITGTILALKQGTEQLTSLSAKLAALEQENAAGKAQKAVDEALAAHKITPAQTAWALDLATKNPEAFKAFVDTAVPILAAQELQIPQDDKHPGGILTAEEQIVCSQLGLKPAEYLATKQEQQR